MDRLKLGNVSEGKQTNDPLAEVLASVFWGTLLACFQCQQNDQGVSFTQNFSLGWLGFT